MSRLDVSACRLQSLDAFRGLVIAGMILVTNPGTYSAIFWPLRHADWAGWTPTDIISPGFLLAVGIAIPFSKRRRHPALHILRRTLLLILCGLLVNAFYDVGVHTLRLPGILQHIAICYLAAALLHLSLSSGSRSRRLVAIAAATTLSLAAYWALLALYPTPGYGPGRLDTEGSLPAFVGRAVFTIPHLWRWGLTPGRGVTFDPDGLLSCLASVAITLIGIVTGEFLQTTATRTRKGAALAFAASVLILVGRGLATAMPLIKKLWSPTFCLFSAGAALLVFVALYALLDLERSRFRRALMPLRVFGTNAILSFVLSSLITTLFDRLHAPGTSLTLHQWSYQRLFLAHLTHLAPVSASLAYAFGVVLLNLAMVYPLYRKGVFLRL